MRKVEKGVETKASRDEWWLARHDETERVVIGLFHMHAELT